MHYSALDLAPIPEGSDAGQALANSARLAQAAEAAGFHRLWLAEHHNMPGIASSATAVTIGHIAGKTSRIRVGAGGIMLPNHAPLIIAEQFGTLAALYPDRIDLGLGRAPGTDQMTMRALRRNMPMEDTFPRDVLELMAYFDDLEEGQTLRAIPGAGTHVPVWMLGSSLYGAQLAAHLGLPYAFASHFAPQAIDEAVEVYRRNFQPSETLAQPYFMLLANVYAGETDEEGWYLKSSMQQQFAQLRTGRPGKLPRPVHDIESVLDPVMVRMVEQSLNFGATGSRDTVRRQMADLLDRYQPDEVMVAAQIHDPDARIRSYEIAAEVLRGLGAAPALAA